MPKVREARHRTGRRARLGEHWKDQQRQNDEDADDDEKLRQGEPARMDKADSSRGNPRRIRCGPQFGGRRGSATECVAAHSHWDRFDERYATAKVITGSGLLSVRRVRPRREVRLPTETPWTQRTQSRTQRATSVCRGDYSRGIRLPVAPRPGAPVTVDQPPKWKNIVCAQNSPPPATPAAGSQACSHQFQPEG